MFSLLGGGGGNSPLLRLGGGGGIGLFDLGGGGGAGELFLFERCVLRLEQGSRNIRYLFVDFVNKLNEINELIFSTKKIFFGALGLEMNHGNCY